MTKKKRWEFVVRDRRPKLTAIEREDRDGAVYLCWWNPHRGKKGVPDKVRWPIKVRNADGRLERELVRAAEKEVERVHDHLVRGIGPRELRHLTFSQIER